MKAIVCRRPGKPDVLELEEIERPAIPDDGVLVRIQASSVNPADFFQLSRVGQVFRLVSNRFQRTPIVMGGDFAGTVESVGGGVTQFRAGDQVFGAKQGAFADYLVVPESGPFVRKPAAVSLEQAAAVPVAGLTALQALRDHGRVTPGQKVLVNGASGGVGTFAVQLAKYLGADVTAVCSTRNIEQTRSLGADKVIDYTREDFTLIGERYDLLIDIAGSRSWSECTRVLRQNGTFVVVGASSHTVNGASETLKHIAGLRLASMRGGRKMVFFIAKPNKPDLALLGDLLEQGTIRSIVDRRYEREQVPEAMGYLAEGHARGKIVITIGSLTT